MDNIYFDDEEITNAIDGTFDGETETSVPEQPVMISEPETTEAIPSIEPNPETIPVVPGIAPPMQDIPATPYDAQGEVVPAYQCGCTGDCETMTTGKYFGTLMESVKIAWEYHLKSKKHSEHVILEEYYDDAQDLIDSLIEEYQGLFGATVENYENCVCSCEKTPVVYFQELRTFVSTRAAEIPEITNNSELMSDIDSILSKIDSTLYKLTHLVENSNKFMNFEEFERMIK